MTDTQQCSVLAYSPLPPGSRVTAQTTEEGVIITVPPRSLASAIIGLVFVSLLLVPMTIGLVLNIHDSDQRLTGRDVALLVAGGVMLLVMWSGVVAIMLQVLRRRRVPSVCTVTASQLILITPDLPKLRHDFPLEGLGVDVVQRGIGINLRFIGALRARQGKTSIVVLRGTDLREVRWIAQTLADAIAANGHRLHRVSRK